MPEINTEIATMHDRHRLLGAVRIAEVDLYKSYARMMTSSRGYQGANTQLVGLLKTIRIAAVRPGGAYYEFCQQLIHNLLDITADAHEQRLFVQAIAEKFGVRTLIQVMYGSKFLEQASLDKAVLLIFGTRASVLAERRALKGLHRLREALGLGS